MPHYLGIEIGGTKLQLGVGDGLSRSLVKLERRSVARERGAEGILEQIKGVVEELQQQFSLKRIGVGFGGPVKATDGVVIKSHQVSGWDDFPLAGWLENLCGVPVVVDNDCNVAAFAEHHLGAGRGGRSTFYVTVGTGIGGGCVDGDTLLGVDRPAIAEIGHLRPGLAAMSPDQTVEAIAAGPGIADAIVRQLQDTGGTPEKDRADLLARCEGDLSRITAQQVAAAATAGNGLAEEVWANAIQTLGWAIAQAITLLAPEHVVVGGGVSLSGEQLFFTPLRREIERYVFPPLKETYRVVPAELDEEVVVHGAIALASYS